MIGVKFGKRRVVNYRGSQMVVGGLTSKNKIDILIYIARELASVSKQDDLFERVLGLCEEIFEADNIHLRLWDEREGKLKPIRSLRPMDPPARELNAGEGFSGMVFQKGEPQLISDLSKHRELLDRGEATRSVVCVPILYKAMVMGTLSVEKSISYFYREDDLEILEALSSQLGLALNEVRLLEGLYLANQRIEFDLRMGRNVQNQIIPKRLDPWNGLHFFFHYAPMTEVSGDYFRVFRDENSVTVFLADVAGHGVAAAMVTMIIHHHLEVLMEKTNALPELFEELNRSIRPNLPEGVYFTAQLLRIYKDNTFGLVNAGHVRPVILRSDSEKCELIDAPGLPLGITEVRKEDYPMTSGKLDDGDLVFLLSDGFSEQKNAAGEEATTRRVLGWILEERNRLTQTKGTADAEELGLSFLARYEQFREGVATGDDLTLVLLQVSPLLSRSTSHYIRARKATTLEEKLELCEQIYQAEPSFLSNLLYMGRLLYKLQDYKRSEEILGRYLETSGSVNPEVIYLVGSAIKHQGRLKEARRYFRWALAINPMHLPSLMRMVKSYLKEDRDEDALLVLNQAVKEGLRDDRILQFIRRIEARKNKRGA